MDKEFNLLEGEKVVEKIKPTIGLFWSMAFPGVFISAILLLVAIGVLVISLAQSSGALAGFAMGPFVLFVVVFGVYIAPTKVIYDKRMYWITNHRILVKQGFMGYKINSIPLERISDVLISRSFVERIFNTNSIYIQTLAGQRSLNSYGSEGALIAVPDPEKTQKMILELIREKRKKEHINF